MPRLRAFRAVAGRSATLGRAACGGVYHNGAVSVNPKVYLICWGYKKYGDKYRVQKLLERYAKAIGGSAYVNVTTQYYEVSGSNQVYITNPPPRFGGSWNDESPISKSPTDAQVAKAAIRGVKRFGYDADASYVVATPHDHSSPEFGTHWCAYHNSTTYRGKEVACSNIPYVPDARTNCRGEGVTVMERSNRRDRRRLCLAQYGQRSLRR